MYINLIDSVVLEYNTRVTVLKLGRYTMRKLIMSLVIPSKYPLNLDGDVWKDVFVTM